MATEKPVLIWGAGAIGGTIGAYLAKAGRAVRFVDIVPEHVAAIRGDPGLSITGPVDSFQISAPAVLPDAVEGRYDTILLCVKAHHTEAATRMLAPFLADDGVVVSVQNGLNELTIAEVIGRARVIGCFINFGADYEAPGVIHFGGRGAVVLGELDGQITPRLKALHETLQIFDKDAQVTNNIFGYLWGKLGYGALLFATALTDTAIADALGAKDARALFTGLAQEVMQVACAQNIQPLGFNGFDPIAFSPTAAQTVRDRSFAEMVAHNRRSAKSHSGIWRDLAVRKRKTEVDPFVGPIIAQGAAHGVATPISANLQQMIHEIEDGRRPLQWANLAELRKRAC